MVFFYSLFVPFRFISPILLFAPSSAFRHNCLPVSKPRIGARGFRVVLDPPRPFFVSILSPFQPHLLYYPLPYLSNIPVLVLPPPRLLTTQLAISVRVVSATESLFCLDSSLRLDILSSTFRHFEYRCMTDCSASPHHQHSVDSAAPICSRKVPIAPCPVFN